MDVRKRLVEVFCTVLGVEPDFDFDDESRAFVDNLIAHGVTVQEWISVNDRLPEPTENPVLVPYAGSVWTAWRHADYWELGGLLNTVCVTHWMPMPQPPKGE